MHREQLTLDRGRVERARRRDVGAFPEQLVTLLEFVGAERGDAERDGNEQTYQQRETGSNRQGVRHRREFGQERHCTRARAESAGDGPEQLTIWAIELSGRCTPHLR